MAPENTFTPCELRAAREIAAQIDSRDRLRAAQAPAFDDDTPEGRVVRAEVAAKAAIERAWALENELLVIDNALRAEHTPAELTRMGRVRWLGDQRRIAERLAGRKSPNDIRRELGFPSLPGQMDVYDCIAEVERAG